MNSIGLWFAENIHYLALVIGSAISLLLVSRLSFENRSNFGTQIASKCHCGFKIFPKH